MWESLLSAKPLWRLPRVNASRQYSPVRSRVPLAPKLMFRRRPPGNLQPKPVVTARQDSPQVTLGIPESLLNIMREPVLVFERRLEMLNVIAGFEQANHYTLYSPDGRTVGFMEENDLSLTRAIMRQVYRLHRPFTVNVYDANGQHALTIRRPFSFINSHIRCFLPGSEVESKQANVEGLLSESRQEWHLWRRRYNLYEYNQSADSMDQFARVDAPFLSFSFPAQNAENQLVGTVDRNWVGLAREMFTDTGVYVVRTDREALIEAGFSNIAPTGPNLAQRCAMLATAVSIDYDYFSRHSSRGVGVADYE